MTEGICHCLDGSSEAGVFGGSEEGVTKEGVCWVATPYQYRILDSITS